MHGALSCRWWGTFVHPKKLFKKWSEKLDEGGGNLEECVGHINAPITVHDSLIIVVFHVGNGSRDAAKAGLIADATACL